MSQTQPFKPNQLLIITGRVKYKGDFVRYIRPSLAKKVWVRDSFNKEIVLPLAHLTPVEPDHKQVNYTPPNASVL